MSIGKIDTSPRKIFSGLTIPGKKMIIMLMGKRGVVGSLIDVYKEEPSQALTLATTALYSVSEEVAKFGPSFRNSELERHLLVSMIVDNYVEILKDIRDFLKLRFRANGLANTEAEAKVILQQVLGNPRGRISMADSVKQALNKDETEDRSSTWLCN